ncbi:uncharacterized protein LOC119609446 [Lucilia sericata]|uniref:uncharacterized protein LOC119609446 n=1 Tax=Lucilia sericata TaxID=13632 RepID=UPI0018A851C2|nr:uncharacterized protein LOC119609446 [Lucilia sericata]
MNSKSRIIMPNEIPKNLKHLHGLKNILLSTTKPTKYIVTLKPKRASLKTQNLETQKVFINADHHRKRKSLLDSNFVLRAPALEKIDEQSEKSTSSIETENCELKSKQSITNIYRLKGGWSLVNRKSSKKTTNEYNSANDNGRQTDDVENNIIVNEDTEVNREGVSDQIESSNTTTKIDNENIKESEKEKEISRELQPATNKIDLNKNLEINQPTAIEGKTILDTNYSTNHKLESELKSTSAKTLITSSFITTVLDEMVPISEKPILSSSSTKCELKDLIAICGKTNKTNSQCDLLDINSNVAELASDLFCILADDKETCKRIEELEIQVEHLHHDLKDLQKELMPLDDLAKFSVLSRQFNEVNALLTDLKLNCLKLQNIERKRSKESILEEMAHCSQRNNQPAMDIPFYDCNDEYFYPPEYLENCNCVICHRSHFLPSETERIEHDPEYHIEKRPKIHERPNSESIGGFEYTPTNFACCQPCQLYRNFYTDQIYSSTTPENFERPTQHYNTKGFSRFEGDKYDADWSTSPDNSIQSTSPKPYKRLIEESIQFNSIPSLKQDKQNNNKKVSQRGGNHSIRKSYSTKIRHSAGTEVLSNPLSYAEERFQIDNLSVSTTECPTITSNLCKAIWRIVGNIKSENIALAVFLESNNLYYINVSITLTGQCLGCLYTNEAAFQAAKKKKLFDNFLTFFVLNSVNTVEQRDTILGHSFEFINAIFTGKRHYNSMQHVKEVETIKQKTATNLNTTQLTTNYKMLEPKETYARIQSVRVKNLEQQVYMLHRELQRIRERMLPKEDLIRLNNILDRLKELNLVLTDLKNHYNNMQQTTLNKKEESMTYRVSPSVLNHTQHIQQSENLLGTSQMETASGTKYIKYYPRENAGYDQRHSSKTTIEQENNSKQNQINEEDSIHEENNELNEPFKTCKQLMDEIKPPGSILGNYLMKLQDFRTDPELRRKRWEKKQQERMQQLEKQKKLRESFENKGTSTEGIEQNNTNYSSSTMQDSSEQQKDVIKSRIDISYNRPISETDSGLASDLPLIRNNLSDVVYEIINDIERNSIALTIVLENDNVSLITSGHTLSCFFATEEAIQEAKEQHLFREILTFFVVNAENSDSQKDRVLGHSFEFIKFDVN